MASVDRAIFWFRNNLRIHDNPAFAKAFEESDEVIPIYLFEDREWDATNIARINHFRGTFILQSLQCLQDSLESMGGNLILRRGKAEEIIPAIAQEYGTSTCYLENGFAYEETSSEQRLSGLIHTKACEGATLLHPDDLPFGLTDFPRVFTKFRKKVEERLIIRPSCKLPDKFDFIRVKKSVIPPLSHFFEEPESASPTGIYHFLGGEKAATQRLREWIWEKKAISTYKETRNQLLGSDFSSRFSPWLAQGCISPRMIYEEIKAFEEEHGANQSTYWLFFELLWRDFFYFIARKWGARLFHRYGINPDKPNPPKLSSEAESFEKWKLGKTNDDFVNANMNELSCTGWMSNRGRQNVASYLIHDMGVDWRKGAQWFEENLIDYDPCSNYGNWLYLSGFGNDPRPDRKFNTQKQAEFYDPDGRYRKFWNQ
jgi:deoxyribodipyrimidine photo-lyase